MAALVSVQMKDQLLKRNKNKKTIPTLGCLLFIALTLNENFNAMITLKYCSTVQYIAMMHSPFQHSAWC